MLTPRKALPCPDCAGRAASHLRGEAKRIAIRSCATCLGLAVVGLDGKPLPRAFAKRDAKH